jgi:predicted permease
MFLQIVNLILPIAVSLALGMIGRQRGWFGTEGINAFKNIVCKVMLPLVLFNAMFTAEYSVSALFTVAGCFLGLCLALAIGFGLRRVFPQFGKYMPFMISTCESGMIGYPLIAMLFGTLGMQRFAMADLPQTVFFFTIAASLLQVEDGLKPSASSLLKNIFTAPPFVGMLCGMIPGLLNLDARFSQTALWETYTSLIDFLTGPTTVLILLFLGYSLSFRKELLKPVAVTSLLRFLVMGTVGALVAFIVFRFVPYDRVLLFSILLLFLLPPSFAVPMFSKLEGYEEYISTTISFCTIITLLIFIVMAAITLA